VVEGETGYLAEPHDLETLAERVATIAQDLSLWRQMSIAGRERAFRNFNIQSMIDNYARLFLSLASEHPNQTVVDA